MAMLRAAAPVTRTGKVVFSSLLVRLSVASPPPPAPRPASIAPSRPSSCGFRLGSSVGVVRNMVNATESSGISSSIPAGVQRVQMLKAMDERLLKLQSIAAEEMQKTLEQLENMEQLIKSLDEKISREMNTKALAAKEILENQQNQERLLRRMKTEKWKNLLSALGPMNKICTIILVGLAAAYFWSRFHQEKLIR